MREKINFADPTKAELIEILAKSAISAAASCNQENSQDTAPLPAAPQRNSKRRGILTSTNSQASGGRASSQNSKCRKAPISKIR